MAWTPILSVKKEWEPILSVEPKQRFSPIRTDGVVRTRVQQVIKDTTPDNIIGGAKIVGGAIIDAANRDAELRRTETIGQQAKRDTTTALKVAAFFPRAILGGLSAAGKSALEFAYTNDRLPFKKAAQSVGLDTSKAETRQELNKNLALEEKLFTYEPKTWQEFKEKADEWVAEQPEANEWERKNLGTTVAVAGFLADSVFGGGKGKITKSLLDEAISITKVDDAYRWGLKAGLPDELARASAPGVARETTAEGIETVIRGEATNLINNSARATEIIDTPLLSEARKYKSAEEFVRAQANKGYRSTHQIDFSKASPVNEIANLDDFVAAQRARDGYPSIKNKEVEKLRSLIGDGEREIKIYRASPKDELNAGDWVTTDRTYANDIRRQNGGKVYEHTVKVKDLYYPNTTEGFMELPSLARFSSFQYTPKSQLTDIWERANKAQPEETKLLPGKSATLGEGFSMTPSKARNTNVENLRKTFKTKAISKQAMAKAKATYDKKVAKIKDEKEILARRRSFIKAVKEQFGLDDADLKTITQRDIRLMTNLEFKQHLDRIRDLSEKLATRRQAQNELIAQIIEKELDVEPLRKAMKLPKISNMSLEQLRELDKTLEPYMKGDVFLSQRKLKTIKNTELDGIRTYREARERLANKLGVKPEELDNIKISELDRLKGQAALAEKDPFFRMIVEETARVRLIREAEYLEIEQKVNALAEKIKTTPLQKLIPQQKNIRRWFEAPDKTSVKLTEAEMAVVKFMQDEWAKAREYLIAHNAMSKGMKSENYFTHIRRGILEAVKEDGVIKAFKEMFDAYKLDEQAFNILDSQTGEILAPEKFFQFALRRTGELKPTENIVGAFKTYMRTFKKKQALDEVVPLINIYAHALTPKGVTKERLLLHGNLIRFVKEWLNTQKGRRVTLLAKQGGKAEWAMMAGKTITTLLDLGLNIPVSIATQVGEQAIQYQLLGKGRFLLAKARALTPKGRRIRQKYKNVIGKNPWSQLVEPMRKSGDRLGEALFVFFRDANVRRNRNVLLGSMTKEEWATETLSPERLAQFQIATARYGMMDGLGSIIGATPEAGLFKQYKTWALPIVGSQVRNFAYMAKFLASKGAKEQVRGKRALLETYRMLELGAFVAVVGYFVANQEEDTFVGKLKKRAYQEAMTLFGASAALFSVPRILNFVNDLASSFVSIAKLETYKKSKFGEYEAGDLKGAEQLKRQLTPRAIKQFDQPKTKTLDDVRAQIRKELESGELTMEAAGERIENEIKKVKEAEAKARLELPKDEFRAEIKRLLESGEITIEQAGKEIEKYIKQEKEAPALDESSFIDKVIIHAEAIGTDPVTAFIFLFQGEQIRRVDNGTIILHRMPLDESQAIKRERGATEELILDHTLPLQLGGSNHKDNLKLVTVEEWERYTPVENYLGGKLRAGLIEKKEAQRLIREFKEGKITAEEIMKE